MTGLQTCYNLASIGKDELAKRAHIKGNSTFTSASAQVPAPAQTPALALSLLGIYTDVNLQRATKLVLKMFIKDQKYSQLQANFAFRYCFLKARNSSLYYRSLYIKCYYFC